MAATVPKSEWPTLREKLVEEAHRLEIEIGTRSDEALRQVVREAWTEENRDAMEAWNLWSRRTDCRLRAPAPFDGSAGCRRER